MPTRKQESLFRQTLARLIVLPGGLILLATALLAALVFNLMGVVEWGQQSYQILSKTRACEKLMVDMETGLRGYLLNKDAIYLAPYQEALPKVRPALEELQAAVKDRPDQVRRIQVIRAEAEEWMRLGERRIQHLPTLVNKEESLAGKRMMDTIRRHFAEFVQVEEALRQQRVQNVGMMKERLFYGGGSIAVILTLLMTFYITTELRHLVGDYKTALMEAHLRNIELAEQKEWFRITLSSIGDAVIVTDHLGQITFMNPEAQRMTGWQNEEALSKPLKSIFRIINENTRVIVDDPVERVLRENKVVGLANHTVLIAKNGVEWPIEDSAAPIHDHYQRITGVVLVFHDASALRQAHRTLQEYSKDLAAQVEERTGSLRRAMEEMEAFSYTVSHDLRSPLRAMQGYAQALLEDYSAKLDESGVLYLNRINSAAQRLDKLIQDLLAYTRLSRDRDELISVNLDSLMREMLSQYPQFQPPRATVTVTGTLLPVFAREATLTQVLSNLLDNAIKFVAPGVQPRVEISTEEINGRIRIKVRDNGIGIAPEDRERIFKIFEQVHNPKLYGGTGIGLAIVKRAVENLGGNIGLESELGNGSLFWVDLRKG
ncbi:MAG: hypothetical protein B9S32_10120 [Verrucomicrobia bacterium Tous-C9LFEB]|nr:MAG: hypothetical protein B9S32_10120 [Verrucomicrobia bacterium Tous-C9LFEB]